jgi:hypothetical protein
MGEAVEFLLIGDMKLKIVMSESDMQAYKLDRGRDYSSPAYRRAFWRVLEKAKEEVGFDPDGDKVLIQFYPMRQGGCEVFVTKLGALSKDSVRSVTHSDNVDLLSHSKSFYCFEGLDDLKRFAAALKSVARGCVLTFTYLMTANIFSEWRNIKKAASRLNFRSYWNFQICSPRSFHFILQSIFARFTREIFLNG